MAKQDDMGKTVRDIVEFPRRAFETGGKFLATGSVAPDPTGKTGLRQDQLDAMQRLSKPFPKTTPSAARRKASALGRAVLGKARGAADKFDEESMRLAEGVRASMRRKRPKDPAKPELRE